MNKKNPSFSNPLYLSLALKDQEEIDAVQHWWREQKEQISLSSMCKIGLLNLVGYNKPNNTESPKTVVPQKSLFSHVENNGDGVSLNVSDDTMQKFQKVCAKIGLKLNLGDVLEILLSDWLNQQSA